MNLQRQFLCILFLSHAAWIGSCTALASDDIDTFVPATFDRKLRSLPELIFFPKSKHDIRVEIFCKGWVDISGKIKYTYCLDSGKGTRPFFKAVRRAAKSAAVIPARRNGESVTAYIGYVVRFDRTAGVETITVFPNWGTNRARYGANYSAAQMILPKRAQPNCVGRKPRTLVFDINKDGQLNNLEDLAGVVSPNCKKQLDKYYNARRWIPAFHEGKAVDSKLAQIFGRR